MTAFPLDPIFWNWMVLGIALLIVEALVSGFFLLWLGVSALVVSIITFLAPDISIEVQLLLFSALSIASVSGWLAYRRKHPEVIEETGLNQRGGEHIGRTITLTADMENGRGKEMLDGIPWGLTGVSAKTGDQVKVTAIDGNRLVVEKVEHD